MHSNLRSAALALALALVAGLPVVAVAQSPSTGRSPASSPLADYVAPEEEMIEARVIMDVMFPPETRDQMMLDLVGAITSQFGSATMKGPIFEEPGIKAIMDEFIAGLPGAMQPMLADHMPKIVEATAIAYTREFTLDELRDIRAFANSPSGARYLSSVQALINDPAVAAVNQELFAQAGDLQNAQSAIVQEKVKAYLIANPEVIDKLREQEALGEN